MTYAQQMQDAAVQAVKDYSFSECLVEFLDLVKVGPDESSGYSDKAFYRQIEALKRRMDALAPIIAKSVTHCTCPACDDNTIHASDCALHNAPALPVGPCDCGAAQSEPSSSAPRANQSISEDI